MTDFLFIIKSFIKPEFIDKTMHIDRNRVMNNASFINSNKSIVITYWQYTVLK